MKDSKTLWLGAVIILAVIAGFLALAVVGIMGYFTGNMFGEGINVGVGLCENVPEPYKEIFTKAGDKWKVQPAFIAAIFYGGEHGNSWPSANGPWASSPKGAQGPFQFMPGTWQSNKQDGNNDGVMDVQNLWDSAFGAAHLLANIGAGGNTADLDALRDAASKYNSGRPWSEGQGLTETAKYVPRVIDAFNKFLCAALAQGPCAQKVVQLALDAVGNPSAQYYPQNPGKACAAFTSTILKQAGAINFSTASAQELWDKSDGQIIIPKGGVLDLKLLQPADVVYFTDTWASNNYFTHVGIYVGNDQMVNTSSTKFTVENYSLTKYGHFAGAKRFCQSEAE